MGDSTREVTPPPVTTAPPADDEFHCPNCMFLGDPLRPEDGFWACQNLCIRD